MSLTNEQLSALKKIKKCLALAGSSNEHEAAAAMRQAQALMKKHGLSESSVQLSDIGEHGVKASGKTKMHAWEAHLATAICDAFGLQSAFRHGQWMFTGSQSRAEILFFGPQTRIEVAAYCYECLTRQMRKALADLRKEVPLAMKDRRRAMLYTESWILAASNKVKLLASTFDDGPLINEYIKAKNVSGEAKMKPAATRTKMTETEKKIVHLGYLTGEKARLNPAMNGREEAARLGGAA